MSLFIVCAHLALVVKFDNVNRNLFSGPRIRKDERKSEMRPSSNGKMWAGRLGYTCSHRFRLLYTSVLVDPLPYTCPPSGIHLNSGRCHVVLAANKSITFAPFLVKDFRFRICSRFPFAVITREPVRALLALRGVMAARTEQVNKS